MSKDSLQNVNFVPAVAERDIDMLLLEELHVSDRFRAWFSALVFDAPIYKTHTGAWHSIVDASFGESDLVFLFEDADASQKAILIENKIDAPVQPDQAERYGKRGVAGEVNGDWDEFRTCIIAPRHYLETKSGLEAFDASVSYEDIVSYFSKRAENDARARYRANFVQEAIEKNRRGFTHVTDEAVT